MTNKLRTPAVAAALALAATGLLPAAGTAQATPASPARPATAPASPSPRAGTATTRRASNA